jgi:hypothetical protein
VPIRYEHISDERGGYFPSFDEDFDKLYTGSGMRAGTYINHSGEWNRR